MGADLIAFADLPEIEALRRIARKNRNANASA